MNKDQIVSIVTGAMKFAAGIAVAHGATKAAAFLNAEDIVGVASYAAVQLYNHFYNASNRTGVTLQKTDNQTK